MYRSITALFLSLASMSSWGQATVGFDLSAGSTFNTGETVTLNLVGNNWTDALGGGGVNFSFNSSVLELESVTINTSVFDLPQGGLRHDNRGLHDHRFGSGSGDQHWFFHFFQSIAHRYLRHSELSIPGRKHPGSARI